MIRRVRCWAGGHQLCVWWPFRREWRCRCGSRVELAENRIFGDESVKW